MKIKDLKDKYKGKMCFLFGGGPSLHSIDEATLKDYVGIAVNSGILKASLCKTLCFVSDDKGMSSWSYYMKFLPTLEHCTSLLFKDKLKNDADHLKKKCFFSHTWWWSPQDKKYNLDGLKLTKDEPLVGARSSMGSALHVAYILGCSPIVLLGNDCQIDRNGKRYFWEYWDKKKQPYRVAGPAFSERTKNIGFDQKAFVEYWNYFAEVNKDIIGKGVDIIDGSDSVLSCFPKMSIEQVLEKYGDRK